MGKDNDNSMEVVINRLEKVERANRWLTLVSVALVPLLAGLVLVFALAATKSDGGAQVPALQKSPVLTGDVIRAKKLEIVDDKGNTRILLEVHPSPEDDGDPSARLEMYNEKGDERVAFVEYEGGTDLSLYGENGDRRAVLSAFSAFDNGPGLVLYDDRGNARAGLSVATDWSGLTLFGKKDKTRAELAVNAGAPGLALYDKDFKVIWQAPPTGSGLPPVAPK